MRPAVVAQHGLNDCEKLLTAKFAKKSRKVREAKLWTGALFFALFAALLSELCG